MVVYLYIRVKRGAYRNVPGRVENTYAPKMGNSELRGNPDDLLNNAEEIKQLVAKIAEKTPIYTTQCRVLGYNLGRQLRHEMGCPKYTVANEILARQKLASWFKKPSEGGLEELKDCRPNDKDIATQRAVTVCFAPSQHEIEEAIIRNSAAAQNDRDRVEKPHRVKYFRVLPAWIQFALGCYQEISPKN